MAVLRLMPSIAIVEQSHRVVCCSWHVSACCAQSFQTCQCRLVVACCFMHHLALGIQANALHPNSYQPRISVTFLDMRCPHLSCQVAAMVNWRVRKFIANLVPGPTQTCKQICCNHETLSHEDDSGNWHAGRTSSRTWKKTVPLPARGPLQMPGALKPNVVEAHAMELIKSMLYLADTIGLPPFTLMHRQNSLSTPCLHFVSSPCTVNACVLQVYAPPG